MPPPFLFPLDGVDPSSAVLDYTRIYEMLPHRHEFALLDAVVFVNDDKSRIVTRRDLTLDDWWVRGHVPGRPIFPGVLLLEMAGQTMAVLAKLRGYYDGFIGYGGVDECKFREAVVPPCRVLILGTSEEIRSRRIMSRAQGVVNGRVVFEARVTGLTMP